jgi:hypothetical protein
MVSFTINSRFLFIVWTVLYRGFISYICNVCFQDLRSFVSCQGFHCRNVHKVVLLYNVTSLHLKVFSFLKSAVT